MLCPHCDGLLYRPVPEKDYNPDRKCLSCGREYVIDNEQLIPVAHFATNEERSENRRRQPNRKYRGSGSNQ